MSLKQRLVKRTTIFVIFHCGIPATKIIKSIPKFKLYNETFHHCIVCHQEILDCGMTLTEMEKSKVDRLQAKHLESLL